MTNPNADVNVEVTETAPAQTVKRGRPAGVKNGEGKTSGKPKSARLTAFAVFGADLTAKTAEGLEIVWQGRDVAPKALTGALVDAETAEAIAHALKGIPALTNAQAVVDALKGLSVSDIATIANYLA